MFHVSTMLPYSRENKQQVHGSLFLVCFRIYLLDHKVQNFIRNKEFLVHSYFRNVRLGIFARFSPIFYLMLKTSWYLLEIMHPIVSIKVQKVLVKI